MIWPPVFQEAPLPESSGPRAPNNRSIFQHLAQMFYPLQKAVKLVVEKNGYIDRLRLIFARKDLIGANR
jgi:hypothetical protein